MRTARPLQGARAGDMYTVLVEAQDAGMAGQQQVGRQMDRWIGRTELPLWGPCPPQRPAGGRGEGLGPVSPLKMPGLLLSSQTTPLAIPQPGRLSPEGFSQAGSRRWGLGRWKEGQGLCWVSVPAAKPE